MSRIFHTAINTSARFLIFFFLVAARLTSFCAEPTLLERIQALPYKPSQSDASPLEGFVAYGGDWRFDVDSGVVACKGESGPRLTFVGEGWERAEEGAIELDLRFPNDASGFSGLCFKISQSGVGADALDVAVEGYDRLAG